MVRIIMVRIIMVRIIMVRIISYGEFIPVSQDLFLWLHYWFRWIYYITLMPRYSRDVAING